VLKYYSVLKRPPELDLNDRLYPLVGHIEMLFRKLKEEHEKIVPSDIAAHFQRFVDFQVANRIEYQTSKKAWDELRALRARYSVLTSQP
ncbi:MAG: hypothetical protein EBV73_07100, partial [Rhodocyclales bacterium]|nr:hypothetical protein [Rhodocyclales bacterium]